MSKKAFIRHKLVLEYEDQEGLSKELISRYCEREVDDLTGFQDFKHSVPSSYALIDLGDIDLSTYGAKLVIENLDDSNAVIVADTTTGDELGYAVPKTGDGQVMACEITLCPGAAPAWKVASGTSARVHCVIVPLGTN